MSYIANVFVVGIIALYCLIMPAVASDYYSHQIEEYYSQGKLDKRTKDYRHKLYYDQDIDLNTQHYVPKNSREWMVITTGFVNRMAVVGAVDLFKTGSFLGVGPSIYFSDLSNDFLTAETGAVSRSKQDAMYGLKFYAGQKFGQHILVFVTSDVMYRKQKSIENNQVEVRKFINSISLGGMMRLHKDYGYYLGFAIPMKKYLISSDSGQAYTNPTNLSLFEIHLGYQIN